MKLPRDVGGRQLVKARAKTGHAETQRKGSLIWITTRFHDEHHEPVPADRKRHNSSKS